MGDFAKNVNFAKIMFLETAVLLYFIEKRFSQNMTFCDFFGSGDCCFTVFGESARFGAPFRDNCIAFRDTRATLSFYSSIFGGNKKINAHSL